ALPAQVRLDAEGDLRQLVRRPLRPVQFGRAVHLAVLDVADDDDAVVEATCGVPGEKVVIADAVEPFAPADRVTSQQMIGQKLRFAGSEHAHRASVPRVVGGLNFVHSSNSSWSALEEASNP